MVMQWVRYSPEISQKYVINLDQHLDQNDLHVNIHVCHKTCVEEPGESYEDEKNVLI